MTSVRQLKIVSKSTPLFLIGQLILPLLNLHCSASGEEKLPGETVPEGMVLTDEKKAFSLGQKAFAEQYYDVAARALSSFVEAFPASENVCEAHLLIAQSYFHLRKYDEASAALQSAARDKRQEKFSDAIFFWSAKCDLARGSPDRALEVFTLFAQKSSASPFYLHGLYNIALCYEARAEYQKALDQLQTVRKADLKAELVFPCALHEARSLMGLQRSTEAQKLLVTSIEKNPNDPRLGEAFFLLGEIAMSVQDYESSLKYYQKSVGRDMPGEWYPEPYYGMGWCHLKLKKYDDALKVFEKIRELRPEPELTGKVDLSLCRLRLLRQENDLALAALSEYVQRYPGEPTIPEAQFLIAEVRLRSKDFPSAIQQYDKVISTFPDTPLLDRVYLGKGEALYLSGNYLESARAFRKASELSKDAELQFESTRRMADSFYNAGDYAAAVTAYREVLEKMPTSAKPVRVHAEEAPAPDVASVQSQSLAGIRIGADEILFRLGWSYHKKGDYDGAIASLETLLTRFPDSDYADNALYRIGGAYCRKGEYEKALAQYERLEKDHPKSDLLDKVKYQMGVANYNMGKYYPAEVAFKEVVEKFPQSPLSERCSYEIGWCSHLLGKEDEALKNFQTHIAKYGRTELSGEALFWIGEYHYNQGKYDPALESFQLLAEQYPAHKLADRAFYWKGRCALNLGKHTDAAAAFSQLVQQFPKSDLAMDSLYQLGFAYKEQKLFAEATIAFQKVSELYPKSYLKDELIWQIGECLRAMGRRTEALSVYTRLLHSESQTSRAKGRYGRGKCFQDAGMHSAAIAELMDVMWEFPEEKELVSQSAFAAAQCYEALDRRRDAIRVYSLIVDGGLTGKAEAEKAIESLRKRSLLFPLE